jgi:hypothetical protein
LKHCSPESITRSAKKLKFREKLAENEDAMRRTNMTKLSDMN